MATEKMNLENGYIWIYHEPLKAHTDVHFECYKCKKKLKLGDMTHQVNKHIDDEHTFKIYCEECYKTIDLVPVIQKGLF